jgi:hypothetical protein
MVKRWPQWRELLAAIERPRRTAPTQIRLTGYFPQLARWIETRPDKRNRGRYVQLGGIAHR